MSIKKHESHNNWLVRALAGATFAGLAYIYLSGAPGSEAIAMLFNLN